jgi:hypothetical protein
MSKEQKRTRHKWTRTNPRREKGDSFEFLCDKCGCKKVTCGVYHEYHLTTGTVIFNYAPSCVAKESK